MRLVRLASRLRLTLLAWGAEFYPPANQPLELRTADGPYFLTADGRYFATAR